MNVKTETKKMLMIVMASTMIIPTLAGKNDKVNLLETPVKVSEVSDIDGCNSIGIPILQTSQSTNMWTSLWIAGIRNGTGRVPNNMENG